MTCRKVGRLLNRYVDGELKNSHDATFIEEHVRSCPRCAGELDTLTLLKETLLRKARISAGESFLYKLRDALKPEVAVFRLGWEQEAGAWARRLIPVPVACIVFILFFLFSHPARPLVSESFEGIDPFVLLTDTMFNI